MLNAACVETVTLKPGNVNVMLAGRVQRVISQTVPGIQIAMAEVHVMNPPAHLSVCHAMLTGWDQLVMTPVSMVHRLQWTVVFVCVRKAGLVLGVTPNVQSMVTSVQPLGCVNVHIILAGRDESVIYLAALACMDLTAVEEVGFILVSIHNSPVTTIYLI